MMKGSHDDEPPPPPSPPHMTAMMIVMMMGENMPDGFSIRRLGYSRAVRRIEEHALRPVGHESSRRRGRRRRRQRMHLFRPSPHPTPFDCSMSLDTPTGGERALALITALICLSAQI